MTAAALVSAGLLSVLISRPWRWACCVSRGTAGREALPSQRALVGTKVTM